VLVVVIVEVIVVVAVVVAVVVVVVVVDFVVDIIVVEEIISVAQQPTCLDTHWSGGMQAFSSAQNKVPSGAQT